MGIRSNRIIKRKRAARGKRKKVPMVERNGRQANRQRRIACVIQQVIGGDSGGLTDLDIDLLFVVSLHNAVWNGS